MKPVQVLGGDELISKFKGFGKKLQNKILRKPLRNAGKKLQAAISEAAPVDSGDLSESVKVRAGKRKKGVVNMEVQTGEGLPTPYVAAVEYGSEDTEANPFIRPTVDTQGPKILDELVEEIRQAIQEIADE